MAEESTKNNTNQQEETPPAQRVTLESLYRRAYDAVNDCETAEGDGMICALLAVAVEIRALRAMLGDRFNLLCELGTGYAGEPLAALRVSNMK